MGLFSSLKEVVHSFSDMGQITNLQNEVTGHIEELHNEGKCPEAVWNAYLKLKDSETAVKEEKDTAKASKLSITSLHSFLQILEENEDKLPEALKTEVEKYAKVEGEVENLTKKFVK